jgi:AcrR family transcriptional regulator
MSVSLTDARNALVRERIFQGAERALSRDGAWTFASVAKAAGVPECTLYRHFPTREALLEGIFDWIRVRLVERGASSGAVEDLGAFHALWFEDPDGMKGEVCLIVDSALREFHAPRPVSLGGTEL